MFNIASEETFQDGHIIIKEGSSGDWVYQIISGSVEISKEVRGKRIIIQRLKEGEIFGELGFLKGSKRSATARAIGPTTLGLIDRSSLDMQFNSLSADFRFLIETLVLRFQKLLEKTSQA